MCQGHGGPSISSLLPMVKITFRTRQPLKPLGCGGVYGHANLQCILKPRSPRSGSLDTVGQAGAQRAQPWNAARGVQHAQDSAFTAFIILADAELTLEPTRITPSPRQQTQLQSKRNSKNKSHQLLRSGAFTIKETADLDGNRGHPKRSTYRREPRRKG
ncbi:hypothetical protein BDY21DRAFT_110713 [Lineolata rhizophorae]|uniref:Uncharacterized protein n=1 Tax=Lineolata rhizophorae TaxID=578093 RepID=A0A6A6NQG8_9PEZI|nr:hypothetical protein BDY21DRAFT_110713 [Lineolata rhizophorae]